jgi:soluble lytic murein transglycosylase-like protein
MNHGMATALYLLLGISALAHTSALAQMANTQDAASAPVHGLTDTTSKPLNNKAKIYKFKVGGTTSFSDIPPSKGHYAIWSPSCFACDLGSTVDWHSTRLYLDEFSDVIDTASTRYDVDPALVRAVIHAESGFNPKARSQKGAQGLMQLMPATARHLGVKDASLPSNNIYGGVKYLAGLLGRFKGDISLAAAAYNAGPEAVAKYAGVPPYSETKVYVQRVKILHQRYRLGG